MGTWRPTTPPVEMDYQRLLWFESTAVVTSSCQHTVKALGFMRCEKMFVVPARGRPHGMLTASYKAAPGNQIIDNGRYYSTTTSTVLMALCTMMYKRFVTVLTVSDPSTVLTKPPLSSVDKNLLSRVVRQHA